MVNETNNKMSFPDSKEYLELTFSYKKIACNTIFIPKPKKNYKNVDKNS